MYSHTYYGIAGGTVRACCDGNYSTYTFYTSTTSAFSRIYTSSALTTPAPTGVYNTDAGNRWYNNTNGYWGSYSDCDTGGGGDQ